MLSFDYTTIVRAPERPVALGSTITAEGQALVAAEVNGVFGVKPSSGSPNERFVGVALAQQLIPDHLPNHESLLVPANGVVTLTKTPILGTVAVYVDGTALTPTENPPNNSQYQLVGNTVTVAAAHANKTLLVSYRYEPTVLEAKGLQGDIPPGGMASYITGTVGVIEEGDVYTSEYDTSANWSGLPTVRLGPNGLFTTNGNGAIVNAIVIHVPSASLPFLGLRLR